MNRRHAVPGLPEANGVFLRRHSEGLLMLVLTACARNFKLRHYRHSQALDFSLFVRP